jgi:hypothetical protein
MTDDTQHLALADLRLILRNTEKATPAFSNCQDNDEPMWVE